MLWQGDANRPHDTRDGKDCLLKAVVDDPDGAADLSGAGFEWDFGGATPVVTGTLAGPGAVHVAHTYAGGAGTPYVSQTASATQAFEINGHLPTGDPNQDP